MLQQFHRFYPQGSLVSELLDIDRGLYIVRVSAQQQEQVLGTGLAAADTVEKAEDQARQRALATLNYNQNPIPENSQHQVFPPSEPTVATVAKISSAKKATPLYAVPESVPQVVSDSVVSDSAPTLESIKEMESFDSSLSSNGGSSSSTQSATATAIPTVTAPITETQPEVAPPDIFEQPLTSEVETQTNIFDQPLSPNPSPNPEITSPPEEVAPEATENTVELDFNEVIHRIDLEMKRLNWTKEQGRDYLLSTYGKRSRLHLTNEELVEFLTYVEGLSS